MSQCSLESKAAIRKLIEGGRYCHAELMNKESHKSKYIYFCSHPAAMMSP